LKGTETILIVDDEDIVLDVGVEVLKTLGYRVLSAAAGPRRSRSTGRRPVRSTCDPGHDHARDGRRAGVRCHEGHQFLGEGPPGERLQPQRTGLRTSSREAAAAFIQKPFSIIDLSRKIREILGKPGEKRAVA